MCLQIATCFLYVDVMLFPNTNTSDASNPCNLNLQTCQYISLFISLFLELVKNLLIEMQEDVYNPHTWLQECLSDCLYSFGEPFLTRWPVSYMRKKALQQIAEFLKYEDENSQYICIGAAQKVRLLCLLNTRDSQQLTFDITAETSPSFE
jgi:hypothetical protein